MKYWEIYTLLYILVHMEGHVPNYFASKRTPSWQVHKNCWLEESKWKLVSIFLDYEGTKS